MENEEAREKYPLVQIHNDLGCITVHQPIEEKDRWHPLQMERYLPEIINEIRFHIAFYSDTTSPRNDENSQMKGVIHGLLILLACKKLDNKFTDEQLCEFINIFHDSEADIWADRYMISRERGHLKEILNK